MALKGIVGRLYRARSTYVVIAATGLLVHLSAARPIFGILDRLLAWLMLLVFLGVMWRFAVAGIRQVPFVPLVCLQYYISYGFPEFSQDTLFLVPGPYIPTPAAITTAVALALAAQLLVVVGARLGSKALPRGADLIWARYPIPTTRWTSAAVVYGALSGAYAAFDLFIAQPVPLEFRRIVAVVLNPNLALIVVFYLYFTRGGKALWAVGSALVGLSVAMGLFSSMLAAIVVPLYLVFSAAWIWGPGIRGRWVAAALLAYFVLTPVKYVYRGASEQSAALGEPLSFSNSIARWTDAFDDVWSQDTGVSRAFEQSSARASGLLYLAQGIDWTPSHIPYSAGRGFGDSVLYFVPRFFWPDKPGISDLVNNRWAVDFLISTPQGLQTATFGLVQPLDGYLDFGIPGALVYALLFGLVVGGLFLARGRANTCRLIVGLVFSAEFFQTLGPLQNEIASLVSLFAGTWIGMTAIEILSRSTHDSRRSGLLAGTAAAKV